MGCPICSNTSFEHRVTIDCINFDSQQLYTPIAIISCSNCGHVYNKISKADYGYLKRCYKEEFTYNLLASPNIISDFPGSYNEYSKKRYNLLFNFIKDYLQYEFNILDLGCASGGFLSHLYDCGFHSLQGIDISNVFVDIANDLTNNKFKICTGHVETLPYDDNQFDFIIADQLVEHIFDLNSLFIEVKRVLNKNGLLCISVPNTPNYSDTCFFEYYWFIMREHIHHFDLDHLTILAAQHGFKLIDSHVTLSNMLSPTAKLPNLSVILQYTGDTQRNNNSSFELKNTIGTYISKSKEKAKTTRDIIKQIGDTPIYVFGMSRELLYLYNNTALKDCNIIKLIDDTSYKQDNYTLKGRHIYDSIVLKGATEPIIITAVAHNKILREKLSQIEFKGQIIEL